MVERVGHHRHHPAQQVANVAGAEPGADAVGGSRVFDRAHPVVQRREADPGFGELTFGPLVAVGATPQRIRRIRTQLDERRSPLGIGEIQVPVIGHRRLAPPDEVRMTRPMRRVTVVDEAAPRRNPLLGLAHQHQPGASGCCRGVLERARDVFFAFTALEPHHRHTRGGNQRVQLADQTVVVTVEHHRGRDRVTPAEQELDHAALVLQASDVAPDPDAVHRGAAEADVLVQ